MGKITQGQGKHTRSKEEGVYAALWISFCIYSKIEDLRQQPFFHIDMNSGCGWNHESNCAGSPLRFLELSRICDQRYVTWFCDKHKPFIYQLRETCTMRGHGGPPNEINYFPEDNRKLLPLVAESIKNGAFRREGVLPADAVGTLLSDPNGPRPACFPFTEIRNFAEEFPNIDIILNVNCSAFARCLAVRRSGEQYMHTVQAWPAKNLTEIMDKIPRRYWTLRNPQQGDKQRYSILIGRNDYQGNWTKLGFYDRNSEIGTQIEHTMKRVELVK